MGLSIECRPDCEPDSVQIGRESQVASYNRAFPAVFARATGSWLWTADDQPYLDFFSGAGANNYGHNPAPLKQALLDYIAHDGIVNSLDLTTTAKQTFVAAFTTHILDPRGLDHRLMFTGPTGTNAVEAALKLARKVTGRSHVVAFERGFHGVSLGSLAATSNPYFRQAAGVPLDHVTFVPYDDPSDPHPEATLRSWFDRFAPDDLPAAAIVEPIQGEGGIHEARPEWLVALREITAERDIVLIVDDIQAGCGRGGSFFSFEPSGIVPDVVTLSKSLSGMGLPLSVVLIRPDLDVWQPAEHNGTFRGNNHAFVTATAAIETYWRDDALMRLVVANGDVLTGALQTLAVGYPERITGVRGRGFLQGLVFADPEDAARVSRSCFDRRLIIERAGPDDEVVKFMPALTISPEDLMEGLVRFSAAVSDVCDRPAA